MHRSIHTLIYASAILVSSISTTNALAQSCSPTELVKLLPSDGAEDGLFGWSVSISGDVAVIGSSGDSENGSAAGAAYVFRFDGTQWNEEAKLVASDAAAGDAFGGAVSVSGDIAIVGARRNDDAGSNSGSAYAFHFDETNWTEETKFTPADGIADAEFGFALGVDGTTVAIGAHLDDDNGNNSGSVYVYDFDGLTWDVTTKLTASDGATGDEFGGAVAISGNAILVGADRDDNGGNDSGAVFVFRHDGVDWSEEAILDPSDAAALDRFGFAVAISDEVAFVGSIFDDDNGDKSGSAYAFRFDGSSWIEEDKVISSDGEANDLFGTSVAVLGDNAMIGVRWDDDFGASSGSVFLFHFDGSSWNEEAKLIPSDSDVDDRFGSALAMTEGTALISAWANDDNGNRSGSAYIYDMNCEEADCLDLEVENLVAGKRATFTISRGTPGAQCATVYGTKAGQITLNDFSGYCATFSIKGVSQEKVLGGLNRTFDGNGIATFGVSIPEGTTGTNVLFQTAQHGTCPEECMSNLVELAVQ